MKRQRVHFLDTHGPIMRYAKMYILIGQQTRHSATFLAGKGNDVHFPFVGRTDRLDHVGRIAAGGESDKDIARLSERLNLSFKNIVKTVVIANGREDGRIGVERNARKRNAVAFKAADQFGNEMLGVSSRAAVTAGQHLAVIADGIDQHVDGGGKGSRQHLVALRDHAGRIIEVIRNTGRNVHCVIIARFKKTA